MSGGLPNWPTSSTTCPPICRLSPSRRRDTSSPSVVTFSAKLPGTAPSLCSWLSRSTLSQASRLTCHRLDWGGPAWLSPTSPQPVRNSPQATSVFGSVGRLLRQTAMTRALLTVLLLPVFLAMPVSAAGIPSRARRHLTALFLSTACVSRWPPRYPGQYVWYGKQFVSQWAIAVWADGRGGTGTYQHFHFTATGPTAILIDRHMTSLSSASGLLQCITTGLI
jgi:hypothetical protein